MNNRAAQYDRYRYYDLYNSQSYNPYGYQSSSLYNYQPYNSYDYQSSGLYNYGSSYNSYNSGAYSLNSYTPYSSTMSSYTNTNRVLGVIRVTALYSGYNCLKANLADSMGDPYMFPSSGVQIGKMITVTNTCAEPVMISGNSC